MTIEERLEAFEAIRKLKAAYCRNLDTKQWDALRALFSDDARFDGFGSAPDGSTRETFIAGLASRLAEAVSVHHCHTAEIELIANDQAKAIWPMMDYVQWPRPIDLSEGTRAIGFMGYGFYEESYRLDHQGWRIVYSRLSRLRVDFLPDDYPAPRPGRLSPMPGFVLAIHGD